MSVTIITPCHKCDPCLKARARLWTARATQEITDSVRTWWGTLTLSPDTWMRALSQARARERAQGIDFDRLPSPERFALWNQQIQPEVTKYLKRVRSEVLRNAGLSDGAGLKPLRYLLVTEAHQSGVPHYHMLVHEVSPDMPVRKRTLDDQWSLGLIRQWRLVSDTVPAHYVCKYLSKDARTRVRNSTDYGVARTRIGHVAL